MGMRWFDRIGQGRIPLSDLALPILLGALGTAEVTVKGYSPYWASVGAFWLAALALAVRRLWPLVMPPLAGAIYLLAGLLGVPIEKPASWMAVFGLACFAAGLYGGVIWLGLLSALSCLFIAMLALSRLTAMNPDVLFGVLWTFAPLLLGQMLNRSFRRNRELAAAAERQRVEHEMAIAAERERIARELHDVLAHSLSVMVVQASVAQDLLAIDPASASTALNQVQQCGRDALGETGQLLRLVRDENEAPVHHAHHTLADLHDLADECSRAGLRVKLRMLADPGSLPVGLQMSAFRIVQEGLTNALKHAPGSSVDVTVARHNGSLQVEVQNGPPARTPSRHVHGGHGLIGIRERVNLFGGTLCAEPVSSGGFRLAATLLIGPEPT